MHKGWIGSMHKECAKVLNGPMHNECAKVLNGPMHNECAKVLNGPMHNECAKVLCASEVLVLQSEDSQREMPIGHSQL